MPRLSGGLETVDTTTICCPNCGHPEAERHHLHQEMLIRTQCAACDYLMITCAESGNVIEAYAPGLYAPLR